MLQKPSMNDCRKKVSGHVRKKKEKHCLYRAEQTLTYICIFFIKKKSTALPGGFYRIVKEKHIHLWSCGTTNLYSAIDGMNTVCTAVKKKKKGFKCMMNFFFCNVSVYMFASVALLNETGYQLHHQIPDLKGS